MPTYTQENRLMAIGTPLGDDVLLLRAISGTEELGRPFHYTLDLLSENYEVNFDDIVGQNCTVRIERPDGTPRFINGYIARFIQTESRGRLAAYRATLVPWLWFLTRTADCRMLSPRDGALKTIPEIVEQVFRDAGFTDFRTSGLTETYEAREYCVQYRETDFNFVSRLLEQEGIYYYFEHENGKHTLVLSDSTSSHPESEGGCDVLPYLPEAARQVHQERITEWTIEKDVRPTAYAHTDFDPLLPTNALLTTSTVDRKHAGTGGEIFDYPGEFTVFSDGERLAKVRLEEYQARHEVLRGRTDARSLSAGYAFALEGHPREDQNRKYLLTSVDLHAETDAYDADSHSGEAREVLRCGFTAIPFTQSFRPARTTPKPLISGPQTAIVAGSSAKEIVTDEHGRVKVKFHWDRDSKGDDNSSCFIRVAQSFAGKRWGALFLPRIGQEVIVEFLEGDPDRPLITGSVYNGESRPPYDLPANKTISTMKTNSTEGGGGFNELRFDDKKGEEQIFIHAEKDAHLRVKNDDLAWIGRDRHLIVKQDRIAKIERHDNTEVLGDRHAAVTGEDTLIVTGDRISKIEGSDHLTVETDRKVKIAGSDNLKVDGDRLQEIGGARGVKIAGDDSTKADGKYSLNATGGVQIKGSAAIAIDGTDIHIKGGTTVVIEAGTQVSIKAGPSFIDIGPSGVSISGPMVNINSGGSAGSGAGCSPSDPAAPAAPDDPDPPAEPLEAGNAEAGEVDAPPPSSSNEKKAFTPTSATVVLLKAAEEGAPFCEECERAAAEQEEEEEKEEEEDNDPSWDEDAGDEEEKEE